MSTEQPAIIVVPTELGRQDGFIDSAVLLGSGLAVWWLALRGVPIWMFIPVLLALAIFVLTGEPAGDVPFIGAVAAGLRSKLGLRRASEWVLAWAHYFRIRQWPDFKAWTNERLQRMHVALKRVRWIGWVMGRTVPTMQRIHGRVRLPLWLSRRLRSRIAEMPQV